MDRFLKPRPPLAAVGNTRAAPAAITDGESTSSAASVKPTFKRLKRHHDYQPVVRQTSTALTAERSTSSVELVEISIREHEQSLLEQHFGAVFTSAETAVAAATLQPDSSNRLRSRHTVLSRLYACHHRLCQRQQLHRQLLQRINAYASLTPLSLPLAAAPISLDHVYQGAANDSTTESLLVEDVENASNSLLISGSTKGQIVVRTVQPCIAAARTWQRADASDSSTESSVADSPTEFLHQPPVPSVAASWYLPIKHVAQLLTDHHCHNLYAVASTHKRVYQFAIHDNNKFVRFYEVSTSNVTRCLHTRRGVLLLATSDGNLHLCNTTVATSKPKLLQHPAHRHAVELMTEVVEQACVYVLRYNGDVQVLDTKCMPFRCTATFNLFKLNPDIRLNSTICAPVLHFRRPHIVASGCVTGEITVFDLCHRRAIAMPVQRPTIQCTNCTFVGWDEQWSCDSPWLLTWHVNQYSDALLMVEKRTHFIYRFTIDWQTMKVQSRVIGVRCRYANVCGMTMLSHQHGLIAFATSTPDSTTYVTQLQPGVDLSMEAFNR